MNNFNGKTAVITGAASGIGFALAKHAAAQGMSLVLADIDEAALQAAAEQLSLPADRVLALRTDVRHAAEIKALADAAYVKFNQVHLLFNNAGVALARTTWEHTVADWEWILNYGQIQSGDAVIVSCPFSDTGSVKDEMKQNNLPFIDQNSIVQDVLVKMTEGRLGLALVGTKEELKGVITDGDIRRALIDNKNFSELKAKDLMNSNPLIALESDNLQVAEMRMREAKVQCLIVKNALNEVVGVIQIFE